MLSRTTTLRTTAALAALLFASACAETASAPRDVTGSDAALNANTDPDHGHVMATRDQLEQGLGRTSA